MRNSTKKDPSNNGKSVKQVSLFSTPSGTPINQGCGGLLPTSSDQFDQPNLRLLKIDVRLKKGNYFIKVNGGIEALMTCEASARVPL